MSAAQPPPGSSQSLSLGSSVFMPSTTALNSEVSSTFGLLLSTEVFGNLSAFKFMHSPRTLTSSPVFGAISLLQGLISEASRNI